MEEKETIIENTENMPRVGEVLWLKIERENKNKPFFWVADKYVGQIMIDEANYPNIYRIPIRRLLLQIPDEQPLLCMIRKILPQNRVELRWMIEEDPAAEILHSILKLNYSQTKDELLAGILSRLEEKETPPNFAEKKDRETIKIEKPQLQPPKIVGKIDLDAINTKIKPQKKPRNQLLKENEERILLEKEKRETFKKARILKRIEEKREKHIKNMPKIGEMFWLEMKIDKENKPFFLVAGRCVGRLVINTENYPNSDTRKAIRKALCQVPVGQKLLCKVIDLRFHSARLRWMIEKDPYAKQFPELNKSKILKLHRILQNWLNKLMGNIFAK